MMKMVFDLLYKRFLPSMMSIKNIWLSMKVSQMNGQSILFHLAIPILIFL